MKLEGRVAMLSLLLAASCVGVQAMAQSSIEEEARVQFDAGVELFEQGQFEQASIAFARAYELRPSFKILYLVGKCASAQRHFAKALDAYTRYLAEGSDKIEAARKKEVRGEIVDLKALVGTIAVEASVSGAAVYVDDEHKGDTPLPSPVLVDLGKHTIVVKRGSAEIHREAVTVAGGQQVVVKVQLDDRPPSAVAAAATAPAPAPAPEAAEEPAVQPAPPSETSSEPHHRSRGLLIGGIAALAVGAGAGVAGGVLASKRGDAIARADGAETRSEYDDAAHDAKADHAGMLVGFIGAGAFIAAGAVLVVVSTRTNGESQGAHSSAAVSFRPSANGITVEF